MAEEQVSTVSDILAPGNQTDINAGSKRDTSSSGIFLIGTENARLHTSDCVAPHLLTLLIWSPAEPLQSSRPPAAGLKWINPTPGATTR